VSLSNANIRLLDSTKFDGNSASLGGALYIGESNRVIVIDSTEFTYNVGEYGGGSVYISIRNSGVGISSSIFCHNSALLGYGGAVNFFSPLVLSRSTMHLNRASAGGKSKKKKTGKIHFYREIFLSSINLAPSTSSYSVYYNKMVGN
jgi:hypothetical protein